MCPIESFKPRKSAVGKRAARRSPHLEIPAMTSIRRSLAFSLIERYALIGLGLVSYVLIARVLTPEEIGIYSVTAAPMPLS